MISYIEGKILKINSDSIIVLTNAGIGFTVYVPRSVFREVNAIGHDIYLYTYFQVKEDGMALFGFLDEEELELFNRLITVSGVGPKLGIALLSTLSVSDLVMAIISGDAKTISTAPGVGKKMAEKIIVELKDKVEEASEGNSFSDTGNVAAGDKDIESIRQEAIDALAALGFSRTEAMKAVKLVPIDDHATSEYIISKALQVL
ncbi:MAG: Holliday junction branch migration protein RuvA [Lachnospiraceae bacterium]|nr:Holliday junction branch migration protein RuvA [Lachnospiraceae bacterium]